MADELNKKPEAKTTGAERTRDRAAYIPKVDIYESNGNLYLLADMPGVNETSVNITLENDVLTIEGSIDTRPSTDRPLRYSEYGIGDFYRSFTISDKIDRDKIEASIKNGVLSVVLPKAEPRTKKIAVNAG